MKKLIDGYVVQVFDDDGECRSQEFIASDEVDYMDDDDALVDGGDETYFPLIMVQPQDMDLAGNIPGMVRAGYCGPLFSALAVICMCIALTSPLVVLQWVFAMCAAFAMFVSGGDSLLTAQTLHWLRTKRGYFYVE